MRHSMFKMIKRFGAASFRRVFAKRAIIGLTSSEMFGLYIISLMDGPTIKDFAGCLGISQPNATYKVNALVEKGYVEKCPSSTDRREYHLYTTKKSRKLLQGEGRSLEEIDSAMRERFSDAQLEQAREVVEALLEFMEER